MIENSESKGTMLHFSTVCAPGSDPQRWMLWLHGIFGSGQNLRTLAKRFCEARPAWGAALVDLRAHGDSAVMSPPHTLHAVAADLVSVEAALPGQTDAVLGHSFGGKVALCRSEGRLKEGRPLSKVVILDSQPGARPDGLLQETAGAVLRMLESFPTPYASREAFIELVMSHGHPKPIAQWLAMNVRRTDDGYRLRNDLGVIRTLLEDYFARDTWPIVEGSPSEQWFVLGGNSAVVPEPDRERLASLGPSTIVRTIEGVGHWVHAEAPDRVLELLLEAFDD